jgi:hypothetical protein
MWKRFDFDLSIDLKRLKAALRLNVEKYPPYTVVKRTDDVWAPGDLDDDVESPVVTTQPKSRWPEFWVGVAASLIAAAALYLFNLVWTAIS